MSWKSFITASLLCALASPAFADPTLGAIKNGTFASNYLDANGNWVWLVQVTPDLTGITGGTPIGAELGFSSNVDIISVTNAHVGDFNGGTTGSDPGFDYNNPGTAIPIFAWEKTYGSPAVPEGIEGNFNGGAVGTTIVNAATHGGTATTACFTSASGCAASGAGTNQIGVAMGSATYTAAGAKDFLQIVTTGPSTTGSLTTTLTTVGAYNSGKGRIAQYDPANPTTTKNFDTFNNVFSKTAKAGDANLDDSVDFGDNNIWYANFGAGSGQTWYNGDYNNDDSIDFGDKNIWYANFGAASALGGSGLGNGNPVPEPASIALMGLASLIGIGLRLRKR